MNPFGVDMPSGVPSFGVLVPLVIVAGIGMVASRIAPGLFSVTNVYARYAVQAGAAIAGAWALSRWYSADAGKVFAAAAAGIVVADMLQSWIVTAAPVAVPAVAGIGYPQSIQYGGGIRGLGASVSAYGRGSNVMGRSVNPYAR